MRGDVMRLSAVTAGLVADLESLGRIGDEATQAAASRLAAALPGVLTARLVQIVTELAAEVDAALGHGRAEVRLVGDDAAIVVSLDEPLEPAGVPDPAGADSGDDTEARITLRLPAGLKTRLEREAAAEGLSLNSHIVRSLGRTVPARSPRPMGGRRVSG